MALTGAGSKRMLDRSTECVCVVAFSRTGCRASMFWLFLLEKLSSSHPLWWYSTDLKAKQLIQKIQQPLDSSACASLPARAARLASVSVAATTWSGSWNSGVTMWKPKRLGAVFCKEFGHQRAVADGKWTAAMQIPFNELIEQYHFLASLCDFPKMMPCVGWSYYITTPLYLEAGHILWSNSLPTVGFQVEGLRQWHGEAFRGG